MDDGSNVTRGFLFADLRGYTAFVETHGDAVGAQLLRAYRALVREAISRFAGAEVRTEGDSFYVTFPSASSAVAAALAIVAAAGAATVAEPALPIAVGIGVHAGETQATDEGPVGSAVNIAARLASRATAGEVLVSETVRGLTRTSGAVRYVARGTRRLKGIVEPVPVFAAFPASTTVAGTRAIGWRRRVIGAGFVVLTVAIAVIAVSGYALLPTGSAGPPAPGSTPTAGTYASPTAAPSVQNSGSASPGESASPLASGQVGVLFLDYTNRRRALAPGTYRTADSVPAYDFTVDAGWVFRADLEDPGYVRLELADRPTSSLSLIHIASLPADVCGLDSPAPLDGNAFTSWLRAQRGLTVGPDVTRLFGSISAIQVAVTVNSKAACTSNVPPSVMIRNGHDFPGVSCCITFQLVLGQVAQAYTFSLGDASFAAFAVAPTQAELGILVLKAEPLLATLAVEGP